jgi:hypothetical protein
LEEVNSFSNFGAHEPVNLCAASTKRRLKYRFEKVCRTDKLVIPLAVLLIGQKHSKTTQIYNREWFRLLPFAAGNVSRAAAAEVVAGFQYALFAAAALGLLAFIIALRIKDARPPSYEHGEQSPSAPTGAGPP